MLAGLRNSFRLAAPAAAVALLLGTTPVVTSAQSAKKAQAAVSVPVVGNAPGVAGAGPAAIFTGAVNITSFAVQNGVLVALGTVTGLLTNTETGAVTSVVQAVTMPVTVAQAACDILHLDLGPLHLNVLGLVVDLNQIVLDVTAQPGPGNLLGNLLCAIAGILDPGGLARLLNDLLAILG